MKLTTLHRSLSAILCLSVVVALSSCSKNEVASTQTTYSVRKNIKDLTAQEKLDYVTAVLKLKQTTSPYDATLNYYDQFVSWHLQAFHCDNGAAHMGPAFLPWHREFLLMFERALNAVYPGHNITIPYWDWSDPTSFSVEFANDFMGGGGDSTDNYGVHTGPFQKGQFTLKILDPVEIAPIQFPFLTRGFGTYKKGGLPTAADISYMLARPQYDVAPWNMHSDTDMSFRNYIEGWRGCYDTDECHFNWMSPNRCKNDTIWSSKMHNVVHLVVGGVWKDSVAGTITAMTSPNDPAFFNLHAGLDRFWEAWENRHPNSYEPTTGAMMGQNRFDNMWPYSTIGLKITPDSMLTTQRQGYVYSSVP